MTFEKLQAENAELRRQLEEAEDTIHAIRSGGVDAFVVEDSEGRRVYTLEGADRYYRVLAEQMQQGAAMLHLDGSIVYSNRRFAEMLNVPHEQLIGKLLDEYIALEDRPIYDNLLGQGQTRTARGEARLRRSDGELLSAYLTFNSLQKDTGASIGVLVTDLTSQKHHEQLTAAHDALREAEALFHTLADNIPQLAWMAEAGTDGQIHWFNQNWFDYTGTTLEEMKGSGWHAVHHPDHAHRVISQFAAHVKAGLDWEDTFPIRGKDGTYRWFLSRMKVIRDESGSIVRIFGTNTDVTDQRLMAEELLQNAADMAEADRRKDEFLATLAHELRNPLAPVRNAVQILHMKGPVVPELQWVSEVIERQIQHMTCLIEGLMDVSRINQGKIELKREWVDLAKVVQGAVEVSRPLIEDNGHTLNVVLPPKPIVIDADHVRLTQVLLNLLNNSAKYTEQGGRIDLGAKLRGNEVVISIRDNGIGISVDNLPKVFRMFSQVESALSRSQGGLGIGLCLVKRLVEMHGGRVEAHSDGLGKGSEFTVHLPVVEEQTYHVQRNEGNHKAMPMSSLRILVVDDNRDAAFSLAKLLKMMGNEVSLAHDGEEAVTAADEFKADVILLDIGLPKLNGYKACRSIRAQSWGKRIFIIAVTGWGQDDDKRKSEEAGFDWHMTKPVDPKSLMTLLTDLQTGKTP